MEALSLPIPVMWIEPIWLGVQVLLILLVGYVAQRFVARALTGLGERYPLPPQLVIILRGVLRWLIMGSAVLVALERLGVSATVLWTALSGFVAVAAVAFFAIWSVLSNLLCAILIYTVGPFRLGDVVELVEATDKPGIKGRVVAINLLYTTLIEPEELGTGSSMVQVPNTLFFQRSVRRWRGSEAFPVGGFVE
ncbi:MULTISPECIES: mechanosensitive ion channel family protein [Pseudomonas]|jgi:small-conductance mechanosensitive channel|uniref:Small-conductance mechanosensitive channel n=2 Tax=Pseudomonas TaxID=286 RepID=A0A7V8RKW7_9PSED|nr:MULTISPECIES: mechanosensitive ion channel family protein [Pseudomonas]MBA1378406.1 mechanosensitive ion channel family protein [Pseudomonas brassicacearum subsp. neoaurantiaca]MBJ2348536.1 mechanosensitive ion channel family protein [Pseudomonas canavaninivorans]MBL3541080.1 mechanosensitive ion channel family protein [Pseudomonas sp. HB05]MCL6704920.1 mechanosensitive ion channel family protein [Pseudomonas sp. T1.Ur]QXI53342.1 mechanosensitive ion channel family protein [Pseudomonas alva